MATQFPWKGKLWHEGWYVDSYMTHEDALSVVYLPRVCTWDTGIITHNLLWMSRCSLQKLLPRWGFSNWLLSFLYRAENICFSLSPCFMFRLCHIHSIWAGIKLKIDEVCIDNPTLILADRAWLESELAVRLGTLKDSHAPAKVAEICITSDLFTWH